MHESRIPDPLWMEETLKARRGVILTEAARQRRNRVPRRNRSMIRERVLTDLGNLLVMAGEKLLERSTPLSPSPEPSPPC